DGKGQPQRPKFSTAKRQRWVGVSTCFNVFQVVGVGKIPKPNRSKPNCALYVIQLVHVLLNL
ncbi:unnamed protein product, partial [Brassica oleracea]